MTDQTTLLKIHAALFPPSEVDGAGVRVIHDVDYVLDAVIEDYREGRVGAQGMQALADVKKRIMKVREILREEGFENGF